MSLVLDHPAQELLQPCAVTDSVEVRPASVETRAVTTEQQLLAMPLEKARGEVFVAGERIETATGRHVGVKIRVVGQPQGTDS